MLLYGKKLAVLPFRKDITSEEGDPLEAKPFTDSKKNVSKNLPLSVEQDHNLSKFIERKVRNLLN